MKRQALLVLHAIYGINQLNVSGLKTLAIMSIAPISLADRLFAMRSQKVYDHFVQQIGFDNYQQINTLVNGLKKQYAKVFLLGFSTGATVAWRCYGHRLYDGINNSCISCEAWVYGLLSKGFDKQQSINTYRAVTKFLAERTE